MNKISLITPHVMGNEEKYLIDSIRSNWIAPLGPYVERFEKAIAGYVGAKYAVAVNSGTSAIHCALLAAGVKPGDKVAVADMTFIASSNPVVYIGAEPVFIDSERESFNIDPAALEIAAERYSAELFKMSRKDTWRTLRETMMVYYPYLESEFDALQAANERMTKPQEEPVFVAKMIVLMWTQRQNGDDYFALPGMQLWEPFDPESITIPKPVAECKKVNGLFPEWAYNWHTTYGKYTLRRDAVHAIENDQRLLTPLEVNLYDDCTWNADLNACLKKHNPNRYELPFDDRKRRVEEKYAIQE